MSARICPLYPETILHNARIYTVGAAHPWAEAIAIHNGLISAVGKTEDLLPLAGPETKLVDLAGRLVLPGLCDAHIHFGYWSLAQTELLFYDTRSKSEMLTRIAQRSTNSSADAWIIGRGWNESWWGEKDYPTAEDLDTVTGPEQSAIFWRTDMHAAVANSHALARAGISAESPDPPGGVIERNSLGAPTGVLKDLAIAQVNDLVPAPTAEATLAAMRVGISALHRLGVTAIHDQRMKDHDDGIVSLTALQSLNRTGELNLRVNCNVAAHQLPALRALGLSYGFGDDRLRLGHVKVFADGSLGSQTALMLDPFLRSGPTAPENFGVRLTELGEMADTFRTAAELGFPISVHAIGDRANREVLDLFEELQATTAQPPVPNRIEHVQILDPADRSRLAALNICASVQPVHTIDDIEIADRILGNRAERLYNFRTLLDSGALVAFGSDAPVADPSPFLGIHAALFRQKPSQMHSGAWYGDERISLEEAIYAYTLAPAIASNWQHDIGSIETGKRADLIALDRNLFELVESFGSYVEIGTQIADTQVDLTVFDGQIVHDNR